MLIYCSTAGETVIIVFLNVVVHQNPLFRIETLAKKYFLQAVNMLFFLTGLRRGIFTFRLRKKCASLSVATWLLAWSEKQYKL